MGTYLPFFPFPLPPLVYKQPGRVRGAKFATGILKLVIYSNPNMLGSHVGILYPSKGGSFRMLLAVAMRKILVKFLLVEIGGMQRQSSFDPFPLPPFPVSGLDPSSLAAFFRWCT